LNIIYPAQYPLISNFSTIYSTFLIILWKGGFWLHISLSVHEESKCYSIMTQFCSVICTLLSLMHDCIHIYMGVQKGQNYPKLVNTMKAHTCNTKRSQKTFEPRANKPNLHKSKCHTHTIRNTSRNVTHNDTKKSNFLRGGFGKLAC
jgi:hypothetical protein